MQGFGKGGTALRWREAVRRLAVLLLLLAAQLVIAAEAQATNWVVNITDSEDPIPLGGTITYTITVENEDIPSNTAPENTLNLTIPDTFVFTGVEPGSPITGCAPLPATGPATVSCTLPPIAGGGVVTLQALVRTTTQGTRSLDAQVPTLGIDTEPANNVASQATTVIDGTDLTLDIAGPSSSAAGSAVTYNFTIGNLGPLPATNVLVSVPVPAGLQGLVWPAGCVASGANYLCTLPGPIAVGGSAALELRGDIAVASTSAVTVTGEITGSTPPDRLTTNNRDTVTTNVTEGSDVKITKGRTPGGTLLVGNDVTFTLTPSFTGETPLGLTITDEIPGNYRINAVTPAVGSGWTCSVASQTVTCTLPSGGAPGHNVPLGAIAIETTVETAGSATNTARIESTSPLDPNLANNEASDGGAAINEETSDLRANKAGPVNPPTVLEGTPFDFRISTTNTGNRPFSGTLVMTDSLPAGLRVDSYPVLNGFSCSPAVPVTGPAPITCTRTYTADSPLAVNATTPSVTLRTVSTVAGATSFTNSMTVTTVDPAFPDPNLKNNTITYGVNSTGTGNEADLRVVKTALNKTIASGDLETFTIEVINDGVGTSSTITLIDDFSKLINNRLGAANGLVQAVWTPGAATGMNCSLAGTGGATGTGGRLTCTMVTLPVCTAGLNCPKVNVTVRPGGEAETRTNSARAVSSATFDPDLANNTGSDTFTVTALADATIVKTVNPASPKAGQAFNYVLAAGVVADGRSSAENVTVTDTLPPGLIFLSATPSAGNCPTLPTPNRIIAAPGAPLDADTTSGLIECNLGTILNGAQQTVTVTVAAQSSIVGDTITNTATVTSPTTPGDSGGNNSASVDATIQPPSLDLQVNKVDTPLPSFGPDPVGIGSTMVYGLTITNNGPSAAEDVVLTDTLPASFLAFQSVSAPPGVTCTGPAAGTIGGTVTCTTRLMLSGATRLITITMSGEARGVATNSATVSSNETALYDTNPANNVASQDTTVRSRADVEVVSKVPSQSPVALLQPFSFDIRVRNNLGPGLNEADTATVTDTLPPGMTLAGPPTAVVVAGTTTANVCSGSAGAGSFTCEFGTMGAGAEAVITAPVQVVDSGGTQQVFTNTATISTSSLEENLANNSNSGQVTVEAASLAGLVFRDFNGNGVQDAGDTGIGGVAMQVAGSGPGGAPVSLTVTTGPEGRYLVPAIPPGTFAVTRGPVGDPALSDGVAIPGSAGGTAASASVINGITLSNAAATGYDFTLIPNTGIAVTKDLLSGPTANADGSFDASFRLTVRNPSTEALQNISVSDPLAGPAPLFGSFAASAVARGTYTVTAAPAGSCGGLNAGFNGSSDAVAAQGGGLAVGASCTIDFSIRVMPTMPLPPLANGGRYINQAAVTGSGVQSGKDVAAGSNLVPLSPILPQLAIAKEMKGYTDADNSGSITLGDILNFRVTATNVGSVALTDVTVNDPKITPASTGCPVLQPDDSCVLTGTYTVTIADVQAGEVNNTATADSTETNPVTGPVTASVTTPVVAVIGDNALSKRALVNTARRGEKVPYVIAAQQVPFNPARIVDVMPPGFNFVTGSAVANGQKVVPAVDGRRLTFDGLVPDAKGNIELQLTLVASASVKPGVAVNQAELVDPATGATVAMAKARVTILAEAVFDCGDIIGKVFDDQNRNGYQDEGEPGLPAVRVATVKGLLVTSDSNGRFNIPCADLPDADIGSNFILKLDTRTLPTGYHLTTENPRRVRLTAGKVVKLNFGASISRLVKLELNGKVFAAGTATLLPRWEADLDGLVTALEAETSVLQITYRGTGDGLARQRLRAVKDAITRRWNTVAGHYDLAIDARIVSGGAP